LFLVQGCVILEVTRSTMSEQKKKRRILQLRLAPVRAVVVWLLTSVVVGGLAVPAAAVPLLPDLFSWASDPRDYMYGGTFDVDSEPGRVLYRFNAAIPNIGDGPFEVFETTDDNQMQTVYQNVYDSGGGFTQHLIGTFMVDPNPPFGHLHLEGLAQYSLREVTAGNGVGPIVATQMKTSHGLVDSVSYDLDLPGAPQSRVYNSAQANPLGVSVGWADLYNKSISTQRIDVTGLPDGQYWLEVEIDPLDRVLETDDTNNTTRILVDLTIPLPETVPGDYNADGVVDVRDYAVWRENNGTNNALPNDETPGSVTAADYDVWVLGYGDTISGSGATADTSVAVPEPISLALAASALALVALDPLRRRRVRSW
jgi:hypothetical protein